MNTLGVIAEYNPFHNGHLYHLQKSLEKTNAKRTVVVMSSTFMQRGEPAIFDKWSRAEMAIHCGADVVLELPLPYACASADYFARGATKILNAAGCTHIAFGAENPDLKALEEIAKYISREPPEFSEELRANLDQGHSFPRARSLALQKFLNINPELVDNPNNILGVEYLRSIFRENYPLKPVVIPRKGSPYHSKSLGDEFPSATAIRNHIYRKKPLDEMERFMPEASLKILKREMESGNGPVFASSFDKPLLARLRGIRGQDLSLYPEIAPGLDNRLLQLAGKTTGWNDLLSKLQTRCFVQTRLQRIFVYTLLDITLSFREEINFPQSPLYLRPLAFNKKGRQILHELKDREDFPLITRPAIRRLPKILEIQKMIDLESRATDLWALFVSSSANQKSGRDFRIPPVSLS